MWQPDCTEVNCAWSVSESLCSDWSTVKGVRMSDQIALLTRSLVGHGKNCSAQGMLKQTFFVQLFEEWDRLYVKRLMFLFNIRSNTWFYQIKTSSEHEMTLILGDWSVSKFGVLKSLAHPTVSTGPTDMFHLSVLPLSSWARAYIPFQAANAAPVFESSINACSRCIVSVLMRNGKID